MIRLFMNGVMTDIFCFRPTDICDNIIKTKQIFDISISELIAVLSKTDF